MTSCLSTAVAMDGDLLWIHTRYVAVLSWRRNEFFKVKGHFLCKCIFYSLLNYKECLHYFFVAYRNGWKPMHKRGIIRYANYTVCASVFIHFCMQRKNNENIPIITMRHDLDLWPFDPKINRAHPWLMGSKCMKFHDHRWITESVIVRKLVWRTDRLTDRQTDGQTDRQSANL